MKRTLQNRAEASEQPRLAQQPTAAQALRESEMNLRSLMDNARDFAVYRIAVDPAHPYLARVVVASPSLKDVFGVADPADFTTWFSAIHPDDLPRIVEANRCSLETGVPFDQQLRFFHPRRGGWVWAHVRSTPVLDTEGRLTHFNGLVADISEQKRVEDDMQRQNEYLAALHQTALGVMGHLDITELLEAIVERAVNLSGAAFGFVYLLDSTKDEIEAVVGTGVYRKYIGLRFKRGEGLAGQIWQTSQPQAVEDYYKWQGRSSQWVDEAGPMMGVPLKSGPEVVGVIGLGRVRPAPPFNPEQIDSMNRFAQLASIALENARLHTTLREELAERVRAEQAVQERLAFEKIVTDISTEFINLGPDEIDAGIQHALQAVGEFTGVDRGYVFLLSGDGATMDNTREWCGEGIESFIDKLKGLPVDSFPWLMQRLQRFEVVHIPRVADLPAEASAERAEFESEAIRSIILVPMIYRGALVGFLGLDSVRAEKTWNEDGIALLRIMGEVVVNALEHRRAQAIQAGQRQFLELLATGGDFSGTLYTLVRLIEEQWSGMLGLVLLLDEDGRHLHIGASVSLPEDYVQTIEGLEIGPMVGSCGTACYRRERVIVEDILTDPRWDGLRHLAVKYRFRACWSEPVFSATGQVVGTFAMYYRQPRAPTAAELRTIEMAAHLVGVAIEHKRAQQALQVAYQTLEQRIEERTRELATLNAIAAVVSRSLDLKEILSNALDKTMEVIQMECGGAYRLEGEGDAAFLNPLVYRGLSEEFVRFAGRLPLQGSAIDVAAGSGQPLVWGVQSSPAGSDMKQALKDEGIELVVSVPLMVKGRLVGAIQMGAPDIRAFAPEELSLLAAIGQQVGLAVENARLYEQAEQVAAIAERSRLARELHDSVTQSLYSVMLYAEAAARSIADKEDTSASEYLRELRDTAQEALREMRLLIFELRPPTLEKSGLIAALQSRLDAVEARGGIQAELTVDGECVTERLPHIVQEELYHIAQEALNNALKHSHARCVKIRVQFQDAAVRLEVCDDGVGFSLDLAKSGGGLGLRGMQERAQRMGGTCRVESALGSGTRVIVEAPLVFSNVEPIASAAGGAK